MKNAIKVIFLLLVTSIITQAQWELRSTYLQGVTDVQFINNQTGFLVLGESNWGGGFLKTTDGGQSWVEMNTGREQLLYTIHFINENTGWVGGYKGLILKTTDGGKSWIQQSSGTQNYIQKILFINSTTGFAIGNSGLLLQTIDGGNTWLKFTTGTTSDLYGISFIDDTNGWICGYNFVFHTNDAGKNWQKLNAGTLGSLRDIKFVNPSIGFAYSAENKFFITNDGGNNWASKSTDVPALCGLYVRNTSSAILVSGTGTIITTSNSGDTWTKSKIEVEKFSKVNGFFFLNESTGWVYGDMPIMVSKNGGVSWSKLNFTQQFQLYNICGVDRNTAFVTVGGLTNKEGGGIYKTTDNGRTWSGNSLNSIYSGYVSKIVFKDAYNGCALTTSYKIFTTTNGGNSWAYDSLKYPEFAGGLTGVQYTQAGLFGFTYAKILKKSGVSWNTVYNSGNSWQSIDFLNSLEGWAVGYNKTAARTNDGGNTWQEVTINHPELNSSTWFTDVKFISQNEIWIGCASVGQSGEKFICSYDGGSTWFVKTLQFTVTGNKKIFKINNIIWVSSGADILKSTDNGESYQRQSMPVAGGDILSFNFLNENEGWLVTAKNIYFTENGGSKFNYDNASINIKADFDNASFLPNMWKVKSTNTTKTWEQSNISNHNFSSISGSNIYSAICKSSADAQNEQLLSNTFNIGYGEAVLEFYAGYDAATVGNAYLEVQIVPQIGNGTTIWKSLNDGKGWQWRRVEINLKYFTGSSNIKLAWNYKGSNGGDVAIDGIKVYGLESTITDIKKDIEAIIPSGFSISQNYPNPFNPTTRINYQIPQKNYVVIKIYDVLGREVRSLVNSEKEAGYYNIDFDASNLPSGLYIYQIRAGKFNLSKKMMLVR